MSAERWVQAVLALAALLLGGGNVYQARQAPPPTANCSIFAEVLETTTQNYHEQLMLVLGGRNGVDERPGAPGAHRGGN